MLTVTAQADDPSEKERSLAALSYAPSSALRESTLQLSLSEAVRSQDTISLLARVAIRSTAAAHAAWDFFTQ